MQNRPVGIAGLKPLFGVRAIAEAAGLHPRTVLAMVESGRSHELAGHIAVRQIKARQDADDDLWSEFDRSTDEIT